MTKTWNQIEELWQTIHDQRSQMRRAPKFGFSRSRREGRDRLIEYPSMNDTCVSLSGILLPCRA